MKPSSKRWFAVLPLALLVLATAFLSGCGGETTTTTAAASADTTAGPVVA